MWKLKKCSQMNTVLDLRIFMWYCNGMGYKRRKQPRMRNVTPQRDPLVWGSEHEAGVSTGRSVCGANDVVRERRRNGTAHIHTSCHRYGWTASQRKDLHLKEIVKISQLDWSQHKGEDSFDLSILSRVLRKKSQLKQFMCFILKFLSW